MQKFWKQKEAATRKPGSHRFTDHIKKQHGAQMLRPIFIRVYPKNQEFKI